uniref:Uncharacterized protein n=1 Tax=Arundo donax TaxID=35708 RepID=A0A0A8XS50_ARUDO
MPSAANSAFTCHWFPISSAPRRWSRRRRRSRRRCSAETPEPFACSVVPLFQIGCSLVWFLAWQSLLVTDACRRAGGEGKGVFS